MIDILGHDGLLPEFHDLKLGDSNEPSNDSRQWSFDNDSKSDPLSGEGDGCNIEGESSSSEGCDEDVDSDELRFDPLNINCTFPFYKSIGSQGGQVGYVPDFHPDSLGSTPAWGNLLKKIITNHQGCLKNDHESQFSKNLFSRTPSPIPNMQHCLVDPVSEEVPELQVKLADLGNACWVVSTDTLIIRFLALPVI